MWQDLLDRFLNTLRPGAVESQRNTEIAATITDFAQVSGPRPADVYTLITVDPHSPYVLLRAQGSANAQRGKSLILGLPSAWNDPVKNSEINTLIQAERQAGGVDNYVVTQSVLDAARASVRRDETVKVESESQHKEGDSEQWRQFYEMAKTAYEVGASDMHIRTDNAAAVPMVRVDGDIIRLDNFMDGPSINDPIRMHAILEAGYQKAVSGSAKEPSLPLGRDAGGTNNASALISLHLQDKKTRTTQQVHLRLECTSCNPAPNGSHTAIRLAVQEAIDPRLRDDNPVIELMKLGALESQAKAIARAITQGKGGFVVGGATGDGKTRTLYLIMSYVAKKGQITLTLEDPPEGLIYNANQISVTPREDESEEDAFNYHFRSALRQDPNNILIGELRGAAAANSFIQSCLTGHLSLASLHTFDGLGVFERLSLPPFNIDVGVLTNPKLFNAISHQVLLQKLCSCSLPAKEVLTLDQLRVIDKIGDVNRVYARNEQGCEHCRHRTPGVLGRTACMEVIEPDDELRELVRKHDHIGAYRYQRALWFDPNKPHDSFLKHDATGKTAMDVALYKMFGGDDPKERGYIDYRQITTSVVNIESHLRTLGIKV